MTEKFFKLDDSHRPGWAKVEIVGESNVLDKNGNRAIVIKVIEILRPSFRKCGAGELLIVSDRHLFDDWG